MTPTIVSTLVPSVLGISALGTVMLQRRSARAGWQTELAGIRRDVQLASGADEIGGLDALAGLDVQPPATAVGLNFDGIAPAAPLAWNTLVATAGALAPEAARHTEPVALPPMVVPERPEDVVIDVRSQPVDLGDGDSGHEVAWSGGRVRVGGTVPAMVNHPDQGLDLRLGEGWCWCRTGPSGATVVLDVPGGRLRPAPSATVLAVVDPNGTCFIAMVDGTAIVERPAGRLRLRGGALMHLGADSRFEVAEATFDELAADSLVMANRGLDDACV